MVPDICVRQLNSCCSCITASPIPNWQMHSHIYCPFYQRVNCVLLWLSRAMYVAIKTAIKHIANYTSLAFQLHKPSSYCPSVCKSCATQKHWTGCICVVYLNVLIKEIAVRTLWTQIRFEWWWFHLRQDMLRSLCVLCHICVCGGYVLSHTSTHIRMCDLWAWLH